MQKKYCVSFCPIDIIPEEYQTVCDVFSKKGLVGEVQHVADLLYGIFSTFEQCFGFENHIIRYPFASETSADFSDYL